MSHDPVDLRARDVSLAYDGRVVSEHLDVVVEPGSFTVIIGPNACGKSTLLRALSGLLAPKDGAVVLDGADIARTPTRAIARRIGLLPQTAVAPEGITVSELVARGRYAHQRLLRSWSPADEAAVADALTKTGVADLSTRRVDELSGGQRQRVWIAMVLAQQTPLVLLDEPTTYLDVTHQMEVLDLLDDLHREGRTIVAVLHDLNHAARYATHVIAMREGRIVAQGTPADTVTSSLVDEVFGLANVVIPDPVTGTPLVVPLDRRSR
ncbi:ABC transporter ATP-binding protein [Agromyces atrinae]|uniref:ABC transporter ATP-binding protein n=1 Tax=Agromyces atrinae TaxID=592376 RepID=A0A4Q2M9E3_9MICO|nr:ABC transporter ATP-binding protein [Agromyces atrinae]MCI2958455.1 ABC transporter ATP-binding protein [Agromyces atrinae]NYD66316.1 iron complex transport system ATP-binding protein [Agromyces atrinae]RXZ86641.1 ABC transporter ATP-binding protein [Agromyces atrinae]